MSFTVRAHAEIRTALLADWRSRYQARGYSLDISLDSDAYCWADAVAFQIEGLEGKALQLTKELFPHTASSAFLEEHASVIGLVRNAATRARLVLAITGTGSWTTSSTLVAPSGALYHPINSSSIAGSGSVTVQAELAGTDGNLADDTELSWSPVPAGLDTTGTVTSTSVEAEDTESDAAFAQRILAYWRERPGGGNRADWVDWAEGVDGVEVAFCYPLLHSTLGAETPGAVTVCVMQPMPTDVSAADEPLAANSRVVSGAITDEVHDLFVGEGDYASTGGKAPAVIDPDDIFAVPVQSQPQDIDVEITPASSFYEFPFTGSQAYSASTTTTITTAALPAGIVTGNTVLIALVDNAIRGGYAYRHATISGSGPYTWTWTPVLSTAPSTGSPALPLPTNADAIRAKALAVFDALGPGSVAGGSARWPASSGGAYPSILYRGSLIAALMGVPGASATVPVEGVTAAEVTLTGAVDPEKVEPTSKVLVTCGVLKILRA